MKTFVTMALLVIASVGFSQGTDEAWNKAKPEAEAIMVVQEKCNLFIKEFLTEHSFRGGYNIVVGSNSVMISPPIGDSFSAINLKALATCAAIACLQEYAVFHNNEGLDSLYYHAYLNEYGGQHRTAEAIVSYKDWRDTPNLFKSNLQLAKGKRDR